MSDLAIVGIPADTPTDSEGQGRTQRCVHDSLLSKDQYGPTIVAHIKAGDRDYKKADDHYRAAGLLLIAAKQRAQNFRAFLKLECSALSASRAYQLIRIADGKTTTERERQKSRESMQRHRAMPKKLSLADFKTMVDHTFAQLSDDDVNEARLFVEAWQRRCDAAATLSKTASGAD